MFNKAPPLSPRSHRELGFSVMSINYSCYEAAFQRVQPEICGRGEVGTAWRTDCQQHFGVMRKRQDLLSEDESALISLCLSCASPFLRFHRLSPFHLFGARPAFYRERPSSENAALSAPKAPCPLCLSNGGPSRTLSAEVVDVTYLAAPIRI